MFWTLRHDYDCLDGATIGTDGRADAHVGLHSHGDRPGLHNLLDFYFTAGAKQAVTEAALLIYRPPLLDILPMYIIFLLFTSIVIPLSRNIGWKPILWTSFAFWVLAQFGFRSAEHTFMMRYIPTRIPLNEMGSFDLWAWQFLWFAGVWLGVRWAQERLAIEAWARRVAAPATVIALTCFITRRTLEHGLQLGAFEFLFDKWHLGPMRILDFAAVAALLILSQPITKMAAIRPLVLLGQSSLQVFCVHLHVLLRRSHADGQRVDAEWMATIPTSERDIYGDVNHSEDFLKE